MQYKIYHKILIFVIPVALLLILGAVAVFVLSNFSLWQCPYNSILHIYCPGCGTTRALTSLIHGDIILAMRQNAVVVVAIILALVWYIELVLRVFGKNVRFPLIHNAKFYYALAVIWIIYAIARNFIPAIAPVGFREGLGINYS